MISLRSRMDPEHRADVRTMLVAQAAAAQRPSPARRLPRRLVLAGLVPVAALATAVAVLPTSSAPPARTAQDVLLVAAERAGTERAGTWWVTDRAIGRGEAGPYGSYRRLGHLTPGGEHPLGRAEQLVKITVTTAELAAAPADPVALRDWLTDRIRRGGAEPTGAALFWAGESLIMDLPVTPRLRAGAYRMLAGLAGVRSLGQVTDRLGRTGTAVAYEYTGRVDPFDPASPVGAMEARLIIDLPTGRALAEESYSLHGGVATPQRYTVMLSSYYTDRPPAWDEPIGASPR
jgi:hypothetical protein